MHVEVEGGGNETKDFTGSVDTYFKEGLSAETYCRNVTSYLTPASEPRLEFL